MTTFDAAATARERATTPTQCCYTWQQPCPGGRPLCVEGDVIVAAAIRRDDWRTGRAGDDPARWLREAASEHASIASFARASLQLLALGAPPELVAGAHAAALDEIEHARLCYGLASSDEAWGPGPLPIAPIDASPRAVALETFLGGCVNETIAALEAADPRIAADEARHAELAWRTLAWLVRAHPSCVPALGRAVRDLDLAIGREHDLRAAIVRDTVLPCARALLGATRTAAARTARTSRRSPRSTPPT